MTKCPAPLHLRVPGRSEELTVTPARLIVAGYTGRDDAAVAAHIAELAEIGVPAPPTIPAFYELDPDLATTESVLTVDPAHTSGEVEPVLVRHNDRYYLTVGSDHTDRDLERHDIAEAKAACPKPLSDQVIALPEDLAMFNWDAATASSSVDGRAYQSGSLAALRTPTDLLNRMSEALGPLTGDLLVFAGTWPLLTGEFVAGAHWQLQLQLPDETTAVTHAYELTPSKQVKRQSA